MTAHPCPTIIRIIRTRTGTKYYPATSAGSTYIFSPSVESVQSWKFTNYSGATDGQTDRQVKVNLSADYHTDQNKCFAKLSILFLKLEGSASETREKWGWDRFVNTKAELHSQSYLSHSSHTWGILTRIWVEDESEFCSCILVL